MAEHLKKHAKVKWIKYPGLKSDSQYAKNLKYIKGKGGSIVVFGLKSPDDAKEAGQKFIDNLKLVGLRAG